MLRTPAVRIFSNKKIPDLRNVSQGRRFRGATLINPMTSPCALSASALSGHTGQNGKPAIVFTLILIRTCRSISYPCNARTRRQLLLLHLASPKSIPLLVPYRLSPARLSVMFLLNDTTFVQRLCTLFYSLRLVYQ